MKIAFRVDASTRIGTGHVVRCSVLAKHLQDLGASILFICRSLPGDLCDVLENQNFSVHRLPPPNSTHSSMIEMGYRSWLGVSYSQEIAQSKIAFRRNEVFDWIIVDHYGIDFRWQQSVANYANRLLVIDDLVQHRHDCDMLLNWAYRTGLQRKYLSLVSYDTKLLLGPDYYILNPEFNNEKGVMSSFDGSVNRILVFYGGVDATNETQKAIQAIIDIHNEDIHTDIVITNCHPQEDSIRQCVVGLDNFSLHVQLPNLAKLMSAASISLGAGGSATYERMFMGLPSIVTTVAENQVGTIKQMHQERIVAWLGNSIEVSSSTISKNISKAIGNPRSLIDQSTAAMQIVDGGGLQRISHLLTVN